MINAGEDQSGPPSTRIKARQARGKARGWEPGRGGRAISVTSHFLRNLTKGVFVVFNMVAFLVF